MIVLFSRSLIYILLGWISILWGKQCQYLDTDIYGFFQVAQDNCQTLIFLKDLSILEIYLISVVCTLKLADCFFSFSF